MFANVQARFALRSALVGVGALLSSLAASTYGSGLDLGEVFLALSTGFAAALAYAGIGSVSKSVEPNIGRKS